MPHEIKMNLQELTARSAKEGLLCPAEQTGSRPDHLSWILAEAKRRTLYAVCMFDDVVNTLSNMPCVLGNELGILPMTCSKMLWLACSSQDNGKYLQPQYTGVEDIDRQADAQDSVVRKEDEVKVHEREDVTVKEEQRGDHKPQQP
ncbi:unnamed protein product [Aureobasidium mustum]|uniref:Uncharacterized protein n=1 Tax=Aureobasidium mustum TaxID=2773714 RepID=A0A9N8JYB9_9PEZI|nr:unnamed protein product [Aureobasidium mustum]